MEYTVKRNEEFNSNEIYFSDKPSEEIRTALKALKMRWHRQRGCWYGFANEGEIHDAIMNAGGEPFTSGGKHSEGYMGAIRWDGINSSKHLYGSELSKEVRKALKINGIKNVTVSCHTYSGGQSLTVKVKTTTADYLSFEDFLKSYEIKSSMNWIYFDTKSQPIHIDKYWASSAEEQNEIKTKAAKYEYWCQAVRGLQDVSYHINAEGMAHNEQMRAKLNMIKDIVESFRYVDSNGQVDYFDTNFYYDIETVPTNQVEAA